MMIAFPPAIAQALKEWQVAVQALTAGETVLLLRKGGIKELNGKFEVNQPIVALYPTYEHQRPHLLKPDYAVRVTPVTSGWHPETVEITSWAVISHIFAVKDRAIVSQLLPYHVWNEQFIDERMQWQSLQPIYLLVLRVYCFPRSQVIPFDPRYGGCRSWITLNQAIATANSTPVLSNDKFAQTIAHIREIIDQPLL